MQNRNKIQRRGIQVVRREGRGMGGRGWQGRGEKRECKGHVLVGGKKGRRTEE